LIFRSLHSLHLKPLIVNVAPLIMVKIVYCV
jgi:hypothetical protein